ncbi:MAG: FadR family transcriptional regulator [Treponema sp.]|jgi:DNA-binding FadR family transcriptional regulator|nr:FadR family transcriptional regulator [Treponema sp.]
MGIINFSAVTVQNKHAVVAAAMEEAILKGNLKVGEKLPSEQDLAAQFGVSRNILREALQDIKARGLVEIKNGAGVYITKPSFADVEGMLNRVIALNDSDIKDYYELRFALEVTACELAASRIGTEGIEELKNIYEEMKRNISKRDKLTRLDFEFHNAITKATNNSLYCSFLQPLQSIMTYMFNQSYSAASQKEALEGHEKILAAITKKKPELAKEAMITHLKNSQRNFVSLNKANSTSNSGGK